MKKLAVIRFYKKEDYGLGWGYVLEETKAWLRDHGYYDKICFHDFADEYNYYFTNKQKFFYKNSLGLVKEYPQSGIEIIYIKDKNDYIFDVMCTKEERGELIQFYDHIEKYPFMYDPEQFL